MREIHPLAIVGGVAGAMGLGTLAYLLTRTTAVQAPATPPATVAPVTTPPVTPVTPAAPPAPAAPVAPPPPAAPVAPPAIVPPLPAPVPITAPPIIIEPPKMTAGPVSPQTDFSRFKDPVKVRRDEEHAIEVSNRLDVTKSAIARGAPPVNNKTTTGYVIGPTADPTKGYIDIGVGGKVTVNASVKEELEKSRKIESGAIKFDTDKAIRDLGYVKDTHGNWTPSGKAGKGPI